MSDRAFKKSFVKIALPVTLQALLQASFSLIDQAMIGRLGKYSIAGIGFAGKFLSIFSVVISAVAAVAGIMLSQYIGKKESSSVRKSFLVNLGLSLAVAALFVILCAAIPSPLMSIYTNDAEAQTYAAQYLRIMSASLAPMAIGAVFATLLRCNEKTILPLVASILSLGVNALLNYLLIFGVWVFPELGVEGAAAATVISQVLSCVIIVIGYAVSRDKPVSIFRNKEKMPKGDATFRKQYLAVLCPLLVCELLWSLGENVYAIIYGNIGTDAAAAMTMTYPVQSLLIGALSGLSQATGILVGKMLGAEAFDEAYSKSKRLMLYGLLSSLVLSVVILSVAPFYAKIYNVDAQVQTTTRNILFVFAIVYPVKTSNMILGGGIIRSGGKTKYIMGIDIMGTWVIGVPLGLTAAFAFHLPIEYTYAILSIEECARLAVSLVLFKKKTWMANLKS